MADHYLVAEDRPDAADHLVSAGLLAGSETGNRERARRLPPDAFQRALAGAKSRQARKGEPGAFADTEAEIPA